MADALVAAIRMRPLPPPLEQLYLTEPIAELGRIDGIMFSGGVGEYVYGREERDFGDMGRRLGHAMRKRLDAGALPWPLLPAGECIRATALGASEYSVQLSGNTSTITNPGALLPRRNLQVLQPPYVCEETIDPDKLAAAIRGHFTAFDLVEGETEVALALRWRGAPSHERIFAFAQGIVRGMAQTIAGKKPLYIMLDGDVAQTLGAILREELDVAERNPVHRRRRAVGLRLHRSRPHPPAVDDRAGDDQIAGVQRGPAAAARTAHPSPRHGHDMAMPRHGHHHHHHHVHGHHHQDGEPHRHGHHRHHDHD